MSGDINVQTFSGKVNITSNLLVGSSHLFVDTTNNRVGITTADPDAGLHVNSNAYVDTNFRVGSDIAMNVTSGRITAGSFDGDGSLLSGVNSDSGSWVNGTNSNVHLATSTDKVGIGTHSPAAELHVAGTGAIIVPNGPTEDRPTTGVNGMIRYNSTIGNIEVYTAGVWTSLTQPPTITGISPLTTLPSGGGQSERFSHQAELVHPTPATTDYFGTFISLTSDGTRAIVGCWGDDEQGGSLDEVGSAHVFKRTGTTWTHEDELLDPSPTSNSPSKFGYAVEISEDGLYAFVGAPKDKVDPSAGAQRGSVHVFVRSGTTWSYQTEMNEPVPDNGSEFGHRVSSNSDGSRVLISAPGAVVGSVDSAGAMYVFTRSGTTWTLEATLDESMVGSFSGGVEQGEGFCHAISLSSDGAYAIAGEKSDEMTGAPSSSGVAHIFYRSGTSWTHQTSLTRPYAGNPATATNLINMGTQNFAFGCSVDITSDGSRVAIGELQANNDFFDAGKVHIFSRSGTTWTWEAELDHPDPGTTDRFGSTVRISANGDRVVVGAPYDDTTGGSDMGSAHIFDRSGTTWTVISGQTGVLHPTSGSHFMMTGEETHGQLAISADGAYVTLGVPRDDIFAGAPLASQGTVQVYNLLAQVFDASNQVFTVTGTGITLGSTVQLEGADGTLYSVVDATAPNAAGTQITFKMEDEVEFPPSAMTSESQGGYTATAAWEGTVDSSKAYRAFDDTTYYYAIPSGENKFSANSPYLAQSGGSAPSTVPTITDTVGTTHTGWWLKLRIPSELMLSRVVIECSQTAYQIGSYVILGSKNDTNWTLLHTESSASLLEDVTTPSAGSTEAFKYFKILIKSQNNGTNYGIEIKEVKYYGFASGGFVVANQPYKVRIESASGLNTTSTAQIGFPPTWTTAALTDLNFNVGESGYQTIVGTDGGGLTTNRTFSVQSGNLPANLGLNQVTGAITGTVTTPGTTQVVFRLVDTNSSLFVDRTFNIVAIDPWKIIMRTSGKKNQTSVGTSFGNPGTSTFRSITASSTGASSRTSFGDAVGLYDAFFTKTGITKIALVSGDGNVGSITSHSQYIIYDLVESSGSESLYDIIKRLDEYNRVNASWANNDSLFGASSVINFTAGTNGYSGTKVGSSTAGIATEDGVTPDKFCIWGINRDSDNDTQVLCAYSGHLQAGKGDQWRGGQPKQSFWSYWGNDWHSNSVSQTIGAATQSNPGIGDSVSTYVGDIYLMAF